MQIIQSRAGPSFNLGFPPDLSVGYPSSHLSQPGLIQGSLPIMGNNADVIRRTLSSQFSPMTGGFKDPNQVFLHLLWFTFYVCVNICSI